MARFAGYVRVSKVGDRDKQDGGRQFLSPGEQREKIEAWAKKYGHELVEVVEDLDRSGRRERQNLTTLVERIEAKKLDGIAVARLNRLARSRKLTYDALDRIHEAGGAFGSHDEDWDFSTPEGELMLGIVVMMGQYESAKKGQASHYAIEKRIKSGRPWGRRALGFDLDGNGLLQPNSDAQLVREAFRRSAEGESPGRIAKWLRSTTARTADGAITTRYVQAMLRNPVYIGVLRAGDVVGEHKHPIIDKELWREVQLRLGTRPEMRKAYSALGGLVRCWGCRHTMAATMSYSKSGGQRAYRCRNDKCRRRGFALERDLMPWATWTFFRTVGDLARQRSNDHNAVERRRLERERDRAIRAIRNLAAGAEIAELQPEDIGEQLAGWRHQRDGAERGLRDLAVGDDVAKLPEERTLRKEWPNIPLARKRELFSSVFAGIVVQAPERKRDHSVPVIERTRFLRRAQATDLPSPGRASDSEPFPPFTDPYWDPIAITLHPNNKMTVEQLMGEPDRMALDQGFSAWLEEEYEGHW
jgi:site-specific DNA recombinase